MNYEEMKDDELDQLAAELAGVKLRTVQHYVYDIANGCSQYFVDENGSKLDFDNWNPTHPDSNQTERYLFPKLKSHDRFKRFEIYYNDAEAFQIYGYFIEDQCNHAVEAMCYIDEDDDQINRTKVIACLKAWDKLKQ